MTPAAFDWKEPDYGPVWDERVARIKALRANPDKLPGLWAHYKAHPADWISDVGVTFDPRSVERGLAATMPFLLFQKQRQLISS